MLRLIVASVAAVVCTDTSAFENLRQLISKSTARSADEKQVATETVKAYEACYIEESKAYEEAVNSLKVELYSLDKGDVFAQQVTNTRDLFIKFGEVKHANFKIRQAYIELRKSLSSSESEEIKLISEKWNADIKSELDAEFVKVRDFVKHVSAPKVKITKELASVLSSCQMIVNGMKRFVKEDERTEPNVASAKNVDKLSKDIKKLLNKSKRNLTVLFVILGVVGVLAVGGAAFYFYKKRQ